VMNDESYDIRSLIHEIVPTYNFEMNKIIESSNCN